MRNKILITLMICLAAAISFGQQPGWKSIRIADTLTPHEKISRNAVILRSELDSLVKLVNTANQLPVKPAEINEVNRLDYQPYIIGGLLGIILLLAWLQYSFFRHQKKLNRSMAGLKRHLQHGELLPVPAVGKEISNGKVFKSKTAVQSLENKIGELNAELHKLAKENEGLNRVLKEYNGIQHEYDSLKHGITKAYKVKNYPGYDKDKADTSLMQGVLATESSVAAYAYEKFLKPILLITDTNKNNPAKISDADRQKLVDLLISLSLLYVEYLYLRINDLSIGGKMVERIQGFSNGNGLNPSLLRKLNTEHGSRALALRVALDKSGIHRLSYPVFDETDLNNQ
jgi:hypothetical protein